ncbi:unnamed protein product [Candidula unifasciata]|uniref:Methyltransferase-like protein 22 n=1 Tax=Candidula unifasciata TaxID=100452 RepID=A0A8S3YI16_9EUPU|nr:unnamed protein product [Candidula unifasciata]
MIMAVYTQREADIVLSDVHVSLSYSENISKGKDSYSCIAETWLTRFYFHLPQTCKTAPQPSPTLQTGSLGCILDNDCSSSPTTHIKLACDTLEKPSPLLDDDGDCILLRRGSQKLFPDGSKSSFQHQMTSGVDQEIHPVPPVLLPVCETTSCLLVKDLPALCVNGGRTLVGAKPENLLCSVSDANDINSPNGISYCTEDMSVCNSFHGTLDKNCLELDGNKSIILKRRHANTANQNILKEGNDNEVFPLSQERDQSIFNLSTDRNCVSSPSVIGPLSDCGFLSVQETQSKLLKSHTTICETDTSKGTNTEHCKNFLEQPDPLHQKLASSIHGFHACEEDNKGWSCQVKSEMAAHCLSLNRAQLGQDFNESLNGKKLKSAQCESLNKIPHCNSVNFSVSEIKTLGNISNQEHFQKEEKMIPGVITLEHSMGTSIPEVGYQVWSGALLLCDYLLHNCAELDKAVVLDLGTGTGIAAIVAAMFAPRVLSTDYLPGVVGLAERNWERNKDLLPLRACDQMCFKILDWTREWRSLDSAPESKYSFTSSDLKLIDEATLILAAEAIYDDELTDGLFTTIYNLLMKPPSKTVVLTLERRVIFSVENKDVCSPAYEHFLANLEDLVTVDEGPVSFTAKKYSADLPQFFHYQRVKELELWKISSQVS